LRRKRRRLKPKLVRVKSWKKNLRRRVNQRQYLNSKRMKRLRSKTMKRKKQSFKGRKMGRNTKRLTKRTLNWKLMTLHKMKSLSPLRKTRNQRLKLRLMRNLKDLVLELD
tara:strand:+ start:186 stop:515 length:330 start_codon:yes stop_codon:yes gene_type:complete